VSESVNGQNRKGNAGPLAWMAGNSVAANLLMLFFLLGGLLFAMRVKQEVFPEVLLDIVTVTVAYPGASPEEVEEGIVLAVEEAIRGVDGIEEVRATASEGVATIVAELFTGTDRNRALNDIKNSVDRITSFPREAEEPIISVPTNRREVVSLIIYGEVDKLTLYRVSEADRAALLADPNITEIDVDGLPPPEISIEVSQENLRRYGLTVEQLSDAVRNGSIDLPGGGIKTPAGELLLRTTEKREYGSEFRDLAVVGGPDGVRLTLADVAEVIDGFRDTGRAATYDGKPAVRLRVYRIGDQTPLEVAAAVRDFVERRRGDGETAVQYATWNDRSEIYRDRIGLLLKNASIGAILVLLILGLFLKPRLAFWVTLGMAVAFLGTFMFMAAYGVSINMISLFAFILALGIVVDDAIVVGEAVYKQQKETDDPYQASVAGVHEVAAPVTFAVLTTVTAFLPLLFVSGVIGKFFRNIPLTVLPILILSLIESFFVLPAHLVHSGKSGAGKLTGRLSRWQDNFSELLERFVEQRFAPFSRKLLHYRYLTLALAAALLIVAVGFVIGGRISFVFFPKIEGDTVSVSVELPFGSVESQTEREAARVIAAARRTLDEIGKREGGPVGRGIYAEIGSGGVEGETGPHLAEVSVALSPAGAREVSAAEFTRQWRRNTGELAGVERLAFQYSVGPGAGAKIAMVLTHQDRDILKAAAERLAAGLDSYSGVFDVDDGFQTGKEQLDITLKPAARGMGISERQLAGQLRGAFFGAEALRQQRGRDELRIYVRLPDTAGRTENMVENFIVRTPAGGEIPLEQAARIERGKSFTEIDRRNGRRAVEVTADVDSTVVTADEVVAGIKDNLLPRLIADYPGLAQEPGGEQQERNKAMGSLKNGMLLALLAMYSLMAVAFRSYAQPVIVMMAIPFGIVGAIAGHLLMGYEISIMSMFGLVALSGVVVNDSLVLVAAVNDFRGRGMAALDALEAGLVRRFRPILLTSLTTFFGLSPMIFETSVQARFLIPMAISLGFGVLFVTIIVLAIVPAGYMVLEDIKEIFASRTAAEDGRLK